MFNYKIVTGIRMFTNHNHFSITCRINWRTDWRREIRSVMWNNSSRYRMFTLRIKPRGDLAVCLIYRIAVKRSLQTVASSIIEPSILG
ncbi:Uncharacterised protein [Vibrio cholerae]|nr:Uncharacterised protein [Vibrio cholerae]CSI35927.1 Uncharacterised protein [Vibrio cholerae]